MRISTSWSQQVSINALRTQQEKLSKTQLQLSTGLKNLTPADDPLAATKSLELQATIDKTLQYQENIDVARTNNLLQDSALTSAVEVLQKARDLAVNGLNSATLQDTDKQALGHEVQQILDNMLSLANTTNASGEYIFSGFKTNTPTYQEFFATPPKTYSYEGGTETRMIQVANDRQLAGNDPGNTIFEFTSVNDGSNQTIFNALSSLAEAFANPDPDASQSDETIKQALNDIDSGLSSIIATQAKTGARLVALDSQESQHEKYIIDMKSTLSDVQDLDYAQAIGQFTQQETILQAAQQSYSKVQKLSLFDYL